MKYFVLALTILMFFSIIYSARYIVTHTDPSCINDSCPEGTEIMLNEIDTNHWEGNCGDYTVKILNSNNDWRLWYDGDGFGTQFYKTYVENNPSGDYEGECYGTPQFATVNIDDHNCIDNDGDGYSGSMKNSLGENIIYDPDVCGPQDCDDKKTLSACPCGDDPGETWGTFPCDGLEETYKAYNNMSSPFGNGTTAGVFLGYEGSNFECGEYIFEVFEEYRFIESATLTADTDNPCRWTGTYSSEEISYYEWRDDYMIWEPYATDENITLELLTNGNWQIASENYSGSYFYEAKKGPTPLGIYTTTERCTPEMPIYNLLVKNSESSSNQSISCPSNTADCNEDTAFCSICINPGATEYPGDGIDSDCDQNDDPLSECIDNDGDDYNGTMTDSEGNPLTYNETTCGPQDCDDTNSQINPGATEICDDGIDNDCDDLTDCNDLDCSTDPVCSVCDEREQLINEKCCKEDTDLHKYYSDGYICCEENLQYDLGGDEPNPCTTINTNVDETSRWYQESRCCPDNFDCTEKNKTVFYEGYNETVQVPVCINESDSGSYTFITKYEETITCEDTLENCLENDNIEPCVTNNDCNTGYICDSGICQIPSIDETQDNSISYINTYFDSNIYLTLSCLKETNTTITIYDSNGSEIPFSIYYGSEEKTNNTISCMPSKIEYTIIPSVDLNVGLYTINANIEEPCDTCSRSNTFAVAETTNTEPVSIPDNNLLIVLVSLISLIVFIKIKEKND